IVEAANKVELGRAMKGLCVRFARNLNGEIGRAGKVFVQRYHARALKTPREVFHAIRYVLLNLSKHQNAQLAPRAARRGADRLSSAAYFDGWAPRAGIGPPQPVGPEAPVAAAKEWLLTTGWRRHGLVDPFARESRPAGDFRA